MAYRIEGLPPALVEPFAGLDEAALAERGARRVIADSRPGFPCRITLEDAEPGEAMILLNHVSLDAPTPFRAAHAIYVREEAREPARFRDELPPVLRGRMLSLRGFDGEGMLRAARLAAPGEAEAAVAELLGTEEVARIHAHNAAHGCFLAEIVRD